MTVYIQRALTVNTDEIVHQFDNIDEVIEVNDTAIKLRAGANLVIYPVSGEMFVTVAGFFA